jgi:hypothetical protein
LDRWITVVGDVDHLIGVRGGLLRP